MSRTLTTRIKNADRINSLITSNKAEYFKAGKDIDESTLCEWFNIAQPTSTSYPEMQRYQFDKLKAYTKLNKFLAIRGLRIKAQNYYTSFHVMEADTIPKQVATYRAESKGKHRSATKLQRGARTYGSRWTKLQRSEYPA